MDGRLTQKGNDVEAVVLGLDQAREARYTLKHERLPRDVTMALYTGTALIRHLAAERDGAAQKAVDLALKYSDVVDKLCEEQQKHGKDRKDAISLIAEERLRQIEAEGWTPEHDDEHGGGQLADAAACYALAGGGMPEDMFMAFWPWEGFWWKPTPRDPVRNLVKAGALIAAEIDRQLRKRDAAMAQEAGND